MIFWHESSATEPGGTAPNDRAHGPGAANIPAMSVAGAAPLVSVSQAGRGQRGGSCDYGADRSALSGPALLRLAPDGGMAGDPRPSRQPQAGAAPDAAVGTGGDLPAPEYEQAGSGTQDLSRTCCAGSRSSGSIRSGAPTLPTSRWPRAFSTWW